MIVGIDEVGRGAWAGPLCVGAVALGGLTIEGLTDSKLLSKKKRVMYAGIIKQTAPRVGIGWVSARDIDAIGISGALKLAAKRAFAQIDGEDIEQIIIDGTIMLLDDPRAITMKKADLLVPSVSAASVIAKVARDEYMAKCDELFDSYGWKGNVGYGAAVHKAAIDSVGTTPLHRMSFAPMKLLHDNPVAAIAPEVPLTAGMKAEAAAAKHLEATGYTVLDRNWRTKWCEIDIIAMNGKTVYFVEVKYRRQDSQGGGLSAITPAKLKQMSFAARLWLTSHAYDEASLAAIEVTGAEYEVREFIPQVLS